MKRDRQQNNLNKRLYMFVKESRNFFEMLVSIF